MKILDWYIIKKFLGTFFYIIMAFIIISVVIDLSDRVDNFIEHKAPLGKIITEYYFNFCIHFGSLLSGILIFLAVVLVASGMAQRSEVIAILSGGVSYNRFLRPFFIAATFLVCLALLVSHIILPWANKNRLAFEAEYVNTKFYISDRNIHRQISPGELAYFKSVSANKSRGTKFILENWNGNDLVKRIHAETADFSAEDSIWTLRKGYIRNLYEDGKQSYEEFAVLDTALNMAITDFGYRSNISTAMNWSELNEFIDELELKGFSDIGTHLIEKHQRTSVPFSIYVFVLIAVAIASRKIRGGTGIHLILAVVIGFAYVFFQRIAAVSAINAGMNAVIAVWIPNVLFLLLGIFLYKKAPK